MKKLVKLDNHELKKAGIPFSKYTLYTWRRDKKNLEIFKKVGGKVFIDLDAFEKWVEKQNNSRR